MNLLNVPKYVQSDISLNNDGAINCNLVGLKEKNVSNEPSQAVCVSGFNEQEVLENSTVGFVKVMRN